MTKLFKLIIMILLSIPVISCQKQDNSQSSSQEYVYEPEFSKGFDIKWVEDSSNHIITVFNPWQGAKDITSKLLIAKDGFDHSEATMQVLYNEADRIICMSSTHIAMLDALDAIDKVVGVSGKDYISNPKLLASSQFLPDIGYEGNIDYEALVAAKPDLVLLFSVNGASTMESKLKELGIPFVYIGDYVEEDPLGKAEWIVALGEIIGKREESIAKFNEIAARYNKLKKSVEEAEMERPSVMVNAPFNDTWFMPSTESYVAKMIEDAGASYIYGKNTGNRSQPIDMEEALLLTSKANYWINIGTVNDLDEFRSLFPKFTETDCVKNGKLYNNNRLTTIGGGNDCYESGVVYPDLILKDMIMIFHPGFIDGELKYYKQLK